MVLTVRFLSTSGGYTTDLYIALKDKPSLFHKVHNLLERTYLLPSSGTCLLPQEDDDDEETNVPTRVAQQDSHNGAAAAVMS